MNQILPLVVYVMFFISPLVLADWFKGVIGEFIEKVGGPLEKHIYVDNLVNCLKSKMHLYGTVRTVVWEDGGGGPATYPIKHQY